MLDYLKRVQAEFDQIPNIICEPASLHFGSGYAPYVEWFMCTEDDLTINKDNGLRIIEKEGLVVDISLLAPLILVGTGYKSESIHIQTGEKLSRERTFFGQVGQVADLNIPDKHAPLQLIIEQTFMTYDYTVLRKEDSCPAYHSMQTYQPSIGSRMNI